MVSYTETVEGKRYYVAEFTANELKTEAQYLKAFWEVFCIPYRTISRDVLDESMQDLLWLGDYNFKVVINGYAGAKHSIACVVEDLELYKKYWLQKGYDFQIVLK